jgi:prepilin-type N-terminal cleavage/methylation domain-containing protein
MKERVRISELAARVSRPSVFGCCHTGEAPVPQFFVRAFTLIELLVVIAIVGILAALVGPVIIHLAKPDATEAATRQMLDDVARARQLAISQRTTVYMVFIPTNFWGQLPLGVPTSNSVPWGMLLGPPNFQTSTIVTQMYGAQWTGYEMVGLRSVGDQPGNPIPRDLQTVKTLPNGAFIAPLKFTVSPYPKSPFVVSNYPIYGFLTTNTIPFPSADVLTNSTYRSSFQSSGGLWLPYIAFNYLGQLTPGDGSVLAYDEYIPLAYGRILEPRDPKSKAYIKALPTASEVAPGGSTNISYNLIHIDRITGRARVERQEAQ